MKDPRLQIINLMVLSVSFGLMPEGSLWTVFLVTFLYVVLRFEAFVKNLKMIVLLALLLTVFALAVHFLTLDTELIQVLLNLGRIVSLIVISVLFFSDINVLSFVASLYYFGVPSSIGISFGVGFKFIPLISDEMRKIVFVQRQKGRELSLRGIRQHGIVNLIDATLSPLLLTILRKVETVTVSIAVQQVYKRVQGYVFRRPGIGDILLSLISVVVLLISLQVLVA